MRASTAQDAASEWLQRNAPGVIGLAKGVAHQGWNMAGVRKRDRHSGKPRAVACQPGSPWAGIILRRLPVAL